MDVRDSERDDCLPLSIGDVNLTQKSKELGIKYFFTSIYSLSLGVKSPLVPRSGMRKVQTSGFKYAGCFDFGLPMQNNDVFCVPDTQSLIQLPWDPAYGWLSCNIYFNEKPLPQCPRRVLQKQIDKALELGLEVKTGMEVEFLLLKPDCLEGIDDNDAVWRYQDPQLEMRHRGFLTSVMDAMDELGWGPYSAEHEATAAQYEINYNYGDAMTSSDRYTFLKFMIQHLAEKEDMRATFMPYLFDAPWSFGNGLHIHFSVWNAKNDINVTGDKDGELGLSQTGRHFLGGLMKHLPALTAIGCPQINSYKRYELPDVMEQNRVSVFGYHLGQKDMASSEIGLHLIKNLFNLCTYGRDSKFPAVRIVRELGDYNRFELRVPDPSANPYLLNAAIIAAGLDGIEKSIEPDPVQQMEGDVFGKETPEGVTSLPRSLEDALKVLEQDEVLTERLGKEIIQAFIGIKKMQLESFMKEVTPFEKKMVEVY